MKLTKSVFLLFLVAVFTCCKKEHSRQEEESEKKKDIEVLEPHFLSDGGVSLAVRVNSVPSDNTYDFGIVISKDSSFRQVVGFHRFENPIQVKIYQTEVRFRDRFRLLLQLHSKREVINAAGRCV